MQAVVTSFIFVKYGNETVCQILGKKFTLNKHTGEAQVSNRATLITAMDKIQADQSIELDSIKFPSIVEIHILSHREVQTQIKMQKPCIFLQLDNKFI